jgi:hypothetical protein
MGARWCVLSVVPLLVPVRVRTWLHRSSKETIDDRNDRVDVHCAVWLLTFTTPLLGQPPFFDREVPTVEREESVTRVQKKGKR